MARYKPDQGDIRDTLYGRVGKGYRLFLIHNLIARVAAMILIHPLIIPLVPRIVQVESSEIANTSAIAVP